MAKKKVEKLKINTIAFVVVIIISILLIILITSGNNSKNNSNVIKKTNTQIEVVAPEDKIKNAIQDAIILDETDNGSKKIESIDIKPDGVNGYDVAIALNSGSDEPTKYNNFDSELIYYGLYSKDLSVRSVIISVFHKYIDEYGKSTSEIALITHLNTDVASKINFKLPESEVRILIYDNLTVNYDKTLSDAQQDFISSESEINTMYEKINIGMSKQQVQDIIGVQGSCTISSGVIGNTELCNFKGRISIYFVDFVVWQKYKL